MRASAFFALLLVDLKRFFRVPATLFWTLTFPFLLFLMFMGIFGNSLTAPSVTVRVVASDTVPNVQEFLQFLKVGFDRAGVFNPQFVSEKPDSAKDKDLKRPSGIRITIPSDLPDKGASDQTASIGIEQLDGDYRSAMALGVTASLIETYNIQLSGRPRNLTTTISRPTSSASKPTPFYFATGIMVMTLFSSCLFGFGIAMAQMKEEGIFKNTSIQPFGLLQTYFAFAVSRVIALLMIALIFFCAIWSIYPLDISLDVPTVLKTGTVIVLGCATFMAISVTLVMSTKSVGASLGIANGFYYPVIFLSNLFIPYSSMPNWAHQIGNFFPVKTVAESMRKLLLHDPSVEFYRVALNLLLWFIGSLTLLWLISRKRSQ